MLRKLFCGGGENLIQFTGLGVQKAAVLYYHIPCECEEDYKKPTNHPSTIIKKKLKSKVQLPESPFTPIMSATQYISCSLTSHNRLKHFVLKCKYFCFLDNIGDKSKTFLLQNCINIVLSLAGCKPLLP